MKKLARMARLPSFYEEEERRRLDPATFSEVRGQTGKEERSLFSSSPILLLFLPFPAGISARSDGCVGSEGGVGGGGLIGCWRRRKTRVVAAVASGQPTDHPRYPPSPPSPSSCFSSPGGGGK